jgi:nickel transport protein
MRKQLIVFSLFFLSWSFYALPAQAHRVNVFAWVEGNTIYTTAKFSGGKVARESRVEVYDSRKKLLLNGLTDNQGAFSFSIPKIDDLEIIVEAGTGHRGSWQIKKSELTSATETEAPDNSNSAPPTASRPASNLKPLAKTTETETVNTASGRQVSPEELEKIVRKVVDRSLSEKLHPLLLMLSEIRNPDPGLKDILGGLGYIFGLVGIAAYIKSRKQMSPADRNPKP